jgi:HAD superfamily hydrolase (TIGR01509 family)
VTRGLLLDLDGTLADSLGVMRGAFERFLMDHGVVPEKGEFDALNNGPTLGECARVLRERHRLAPPVPVLVDRWMSIVAESYRTVEPVPGAREVLEVARTRGWRSCVVTSSKRELALGWLDSQGFGRLLAAVVTSDEVRRGKPSPDPYLEGLRRIDCRPAEAMAVEDSPGGAASALAAGIHTCIVGDHPGPFPSGAVRLPSLDAVISVLDRP